MDEQTTLAPCFACGADDVSVAGKSDKYFPYCNDCGQIGPDFSTEENAIRWWNNPRPPAWIAVTDRLPENDGWVLVATSHGVEVAQWIADGYGSTVWSDVDASRIPNVTHWMPLPAPPPAHGGEFVVE